MTQRKLRTTLTILCLALAMTSMTAISFVYDSGQQAVSKTLPGKDSSLVIIQIDDQAFNTNPVFDLEFVQNVESTYQKKFSFLKNGLLQDFYIEGINQKNFLAGNSLSGFRPDKTSSSVDTHDMYLDSSITQYLDLNIGNTIELGEIQNGVNRDISLTIIGLGKNELSMGFSYTSRLRGWMDLSSLNDIVNTENYINTIYLKVSTKNLDETTIKASLLNKFDNLGVSIDRIAFLNANSDPRFSFLALAVNLGNFVTLLTLFVGSLLAATIVHINVKDDKKDQAIMKILGIQRLELFIIYFLEVIIIGLLGSFLGLLFSLVLTKVLLTIIAEPLGLLSIPMIINSGNVINAILLTVLFPFFFSLPSLIRLYNTVPVELLSKMENPSKPSKPEPTRHKFLLLVIYRNMKKKKLNTILMVVVISISVAVFTGIRISINSVDHDNSAFFNSYPADIIIDSRSYMDQKQAYKFVNDFFSTHFPSELNDFTLMIWAVMEYNTNNEPTNALSHEVLVQGLPQKASELQSLNFIDATDTNSFLENSSEILISQRFIDYQVDYLGLDSILYLGKSNVSRPFRITGIIDPLTDFGWSIYAPLDAVMEILGRTGQINRIQIRLHDTSNIKQIISVMQTEDFITSADSSVLATNQFAVRNNRSLNFYRISGDIVAWIGIAVCVFASVNILIVNVIDRRKDIAVLKLIGARRNWIMWIFLVEFSLITFVSAIIGILIAKYYVAVRLLTIARYQYKIVEVLMTSHDVIFSFEIAGLIALVSAVFPLYIIMRESVSKTGINDPL